MHRNCGAAPARAAASPELAEEGCEAHAPSRSRRWTTTTTRIAKRVELHFERLEDLLMQSGLPLDMDYSAWRMQQISLLSQGDLSLEVANPVQIQAGQGVQLVRSGQVQQQYGYSGRGYSVAVIDTGIDYNHSAFQGRYLGGYDFVDNDADPMDLNGHGTHVAGIIGSADPAHLGLAPQVGLIGLRVLDQNGSGNFGAVKDALAWVVSHQRQYNIVAVNMSLGSGNFAANPYSFLDADLQTLKSQGVFVAAAAGNSFFTNNSQQGLGYPAISNLTVSVGAVWDGDYGSVAWASGARDYSTGVDRVTSFSQRGGMLNLLAPGAFITSTYLGGGYATLAGTSMATPVVAGAAVLVHQALDAAGRGNLANQDQILSILRANGVTVVDGDDENDNVTNTGLSFKRIDVLSAVQSLAGTPNNPNNGGNRLTPNQAFVSGVYRDLLGREADAGGLSYWGSALDRGVSRTQLVHAFWVSAEHRSNEVTSYYTNYLHRTPSASERASVVGRFSSGASETTVVRAFLNSGEYSRLHASNSAFVDGLFQDLFRRAPDAGGAAYWTGRLAGGVSRTQVIDALLGTTERYVNVVRDYYQDFLGRAGSTSEFLYWAGRIQRGSIGMESVGESFLASQEYFNRVGSLGALGETRGLTSSSAALESDPTDEVYRGFGMEMSMPTGDEARELVDHKHAEMEEEHEHEHHVAEGEGEGEGEGEHHAQSTSMTTFGTNSHASATDAAHRQGNSHERSAEHVWRQRLDQWSKFEAELGESLDEVADQVLALLA